jgi:hypothetical protein
MPAIPIIAAVGGSVIGAIGSHAAAGAQAGAAKSAAQLQAQSAQNALDFQKQQWQTQQQNEAPWLKAGQGAIGQLSNLASNFQPWTQQFQAPTGATEQNDPGYQFRLQQGNQALQSAAAARGNLLTGGTAKAIQQYGQDYASNEYSNVYNRALGQYQQNYDIFQQNQANQFNRLASVAGMGQTAAGQLGSLGQAASGNVSNVLLGSAGQIGQSLQNQGAATASGYAGIANAAAGGLNNLSQMYQLQQILGQGQQQTPQYGPSPDQAGFPG